MEFLQPKQVEEVIHRGHIKLPNKYPHDRLNEPFPVGLLFKTLHNGEKVKRDWLVWSQIKDAFFCLPCRLISTSTLYRSKLCCASGYSKDQPWKKLYDKLPSHENSKDHVECYVKFRDMQTRLHQLSSVDMLFSDQLASETKKWQQILTRI